MEQINRIKATLAEQHHTRKWFTEAIGENEAIISK